MKEKLRVAFDHRIFISQVHGGMSRYYCGLAMNLPEFDIDPLIIAPLHATEKLSDLPSNMVLGVRIDPTPRKQRLAHIVSEASHGAIATIAGAKIVHETYYNFNRRAPKRCKIVTTIHDMIPEMFPQYWPEDVTPAIKKASADRADWVLCPSHSSRQDLLTFYPRLESRSSVVYLGFEPFFAAEKPGSRMHPNPYVLYIGWRGGWKNFEGLFHAYAQSRLPQEGVDMVCIGGGAMTSTELETIHEAGLDGRVVQRQANDVELANWYRGARLFAYPSHYEGFGIPPLEAMSADCPVVAGRTSSVPEVCGNAVEWAEPGSRDSLTHALESVALSDSRAEALRMAGREQVKKFSWRKCAFETSQVYKALV